MLPPISFTTIDTAQNTAGTTTLTYNAAGPGRSHVITGICFSFSAAPSSPVTATIQDGSTVIPLLQIAAAGPNPVSFFPPRAGGPNSALSISLPSGGPGVIGKINVLGHFTTTAPLMGQGVGSWFGITSPTSATHGVGLTVTIANLTATGSVNTGYTGKVHFTSTDTGATLPANSTLTSGQGTFSVTLSVAGTFSITVSDSVDTAQSGRSASITAA